MPIGLVFLDLKKKLYADRRASVNRSSSVWARPAAGTRMMANRAMPNFIEASWIVRVSIYCMAKVRRVECRDNDMGMSF